MKTIYEWCVELREVYEDGEYDIIDTDRSEKLKDVIAGLNEPVAKGTMVLVLDRSVWCEYEGRVSQAWADVEDEVLASEFLDCYGRFEAKVPKKCIQEFESVMMRRLTH